MRSIRVKAVALTALIASMWSPHVYAIHNGSEVGVGIDSQDKAHAVVRVGYCTGTAIAPHWVITANHCMKNVKKKIPIHRSLERKKIQDPTPYFGKWYFHHPEADLTLVYLDKPFEDGPFAVVGSGKVASSTPAEVYGWGTGTGQRLGHTTAKVAIDGWGSIGYHSRALFVIYDNYGYAGGGDSGGPLFVDNKLVGVLSSGNQTVSDFDELNGKLEWIKHTMAQGPRQAFSTHFPSEPLDGPRYQQEVFSEAPTIEPLSSGEIYTEEQPKEGSDSQAPQPPRVQEDPAPSTTTPEVAPPATSDDSNLPPSTGTESDVDKLTPQPQPSPESQPEPEFEPQPLPNLQPETSLRPQPTPQQQPQPLPQPELTPQPTPTALSTHSTLFAVIATVLGALGVLVASLVHLTRSHRIV